MYFIFDLKRLNDSEFLISKKLFFQIWWFLKAIVWIPYFVVDLCLNFILKGNHLFETLCSLLVETNQLKVQKFQWKEILNF